MKRLSLILIFFAATLLYAGPSDLELFLQTLPVKEVRPLESESIYHEIYEVMIEQPLDHHNPDGEKFLQRIYISNYDPSQPVVMITEGYSANYYYTSEISSTLKCNQIIVEHRYFGRSVPDSLNWTYLNTWQAASDHHRIIELFSGFYRDKWITTGISKGGQTVMFHSFYYPDDADVRIPYVAPLNRAKEDPRVYTFLDHVGTAKCRKGVHNFQKMALKRENECLDDFKKLSDKKGYTYELVGGIEKAYEYCVLEYSFAFWQWGYVSCSDIPGKKVSPMRLVSHMNQVAGFDYFADTFIVEYQPFFYQALTEMGYYGYDLHEFHRELQHVTESGFGFTMPAGADTTFHPGLLTELDDYIRNRAENFIFIYGENDTWSSTKAELSGSTNSVIFIKPGGSHRTRIRNMTEEMQKEVYSTIHRFLGE